MRLASLMGVQRDIANATKCPDCGKRRLVLNTGGYRQPSRPETVTAETHCTCPGGPAHTAGEVTNPPTN